MENFIFNEKEIKDVYTVEPRIFGDNRGYFMETYVKKDFDEAVDLRASKPTYGKWVGEVLSADKKNMMLIPRGFAHGFVVLSGYAEFIYKCDDYYHLEDEGGIIWNDPDIEI